MYARWNLWRAIVLGACVGALVATFDLVGNWDMSQAAHQLGPIVRLDYRRRDTLRFGRRRPQLDAQGLSQGARSFKMDPLPASDGAKLHMP